MAAYKVNKGLDNEQGFVLITILVAISLLFPIVIAFYGKTQINLLQAGNFRDTIQAARMARSGVEGVIGLLRNDDPSYDGKTDTWAMPFPPLTVGNNEAVVAIVDEESKLNINMIVNKDGKADRNMVDRFKALIERLGGRPEIVNALIDWIDTDSLVTDPGGAEEGGYESFEYSVKNGPLDTLDELLLVKGFDKELLFEKGLGKFITVAPTDGKVNINTAPVEILNDLGFREGLVQEIVSAREKEPFKQLGDAWQVLGVDAKSLPPGIEQKVKVTSSVFTVRSKGLCGKIAKEVEATLKRDSAGITIVFWREL
ncbi:type II secretion system minor pseudopilin GspK [Syntrophorhabdus aromaticivorans]|uniref:Type II secretion system minor pseudopilin GspK n=1 Tax=Syntrophorhabdus aromaticivorans TaxID=328301 RepID=A0A971M557_9BACT|nr:type II secretion system minor pseudopilin GspK [Syntrophorhabdus aromaticivorans]NLW35286.1 type II secretion system minor pseudopilin GspK [Syntrophorhabdus aromaticivorans]